MVVRSENNTFFTPTPGATYNNGDAVSADDVVVYRGSATSITNSGLSASQEYYYKLYSENWSYYSSGSVTGGITTAGPGAGIPTVQAPTAIATDSFTANWSSSTNANSYRLDVSTSQAFSTYVSGYQDRVVNGTSESVTGLTPGSTYYYRVSGYNAAGQSGESAVTNLVTPASVTLAMQSSTVGNSGSPGSASFGATDGARYTKWYSDDGGVNWTSDETVTASGGAVTVDMDEEGQSKRIFLVKPEGITPVQSDLNTTPATAVIKPTVSPGFTMMAPPVKTDRQFHGEFGNMLADGLSDNDEVYVYSGGSFRTFYLESGVWKEGASSVTYTLGDGEGYYLNRKTASATTSRFEGLLGNRTDEPSTGTISSGWNIIGPSQGRGQTFNQVVDGIVNPATAFSEDQADLIVIDEGNGNWRRIMKYGSGGQWLDLKSFTLSPNVTIEPGQAVYYYRTGSGTTIEF